MFRNDLSGEEEAGNQGLLKMRRWRVSTRILT